MSLLFFFNDTATTEIYTLSLHDALPIYDVAEDEQGDAAEHRSDDRAGDERLLVGVLEVRDAAEAGEDDGGDDAAADEDRKSTRLNSSHANISYAVFCLKKKKNHLYRTI